MRLNSGFGTYLTDKNLIAVPNTRDVGMGADPFYAKYYDYGMPGYINPDA